MSMSSLVATQRAMLAVALCVSVACQTGDAPVATTAPAPATAPDADKSASTEPAAQRLTDLAPAAGLRPFHVEVDGQVAGIDFAPQYGLAVRGHLEVGDRAELLVFVASDRPDMCEHLQQGTLPANSTMFATGLLQDSGDAVTTPGTVFKAAGSQDYPPVPMANGFFRQLDHACQIDARLLPRGGEALYGDATVTALDADRASVQFAYEMIVNDDDAAVVGTIKGDMTVPWCDAPLVFINAEQLHTGEVKPNMCR